MKPQDYEVVIRPLAEGEGGGYLAAVPELGGCKSDGATPQEALDNVYDAIECWMEAAREMGRPFPEPKRAAA
ncbi:MAG TPA: type II toxin-antitoxin system HicB family antitoxin [Allosphingosinicella sp.]|nr:type II toxin-antitoxin system HicB family antitoxin [Allosphingosinicella sp.]